MAWPHLFPLFFTIVCLMHSTYSGHGRNSAEFSLTSRTNISSPRCVQVFLAKEARCSKRNLEYVPSYLYEDTLELYLSYNKIRTLYNTSFSKYSLLEWLILNDNDIQFIETAAFYPLKHLDTLTLENNRHIHIPNSDIFRWSAKLQFLGLGWCLLPYFPNDIFRWLPRLRYIDLIGNRLSSINFTYCPREETLVTVYLNENPLYSLTQETFKFSCKCQQLSFENIPFKHVDPHVFSTMQVFILEIGFDEYMAYSFQVYKDLFTGIAQSSIESFIFNFPLQGEFTIPLNSFDPLGGKNLSNLTLQGNSLRLQPFVFRNLSYLNQLMILETDIDEIRPEYFDGMFGLCVLDLHSNKIVNINPEHSSWNLNITQLNLCHNDIYVLSKDTFTGLKYLLKLDLSDNPHFHFRSPSWHSSLPNLKYLDVSGTAFSVDEAFYFPHLLNFSFSRRIPTGESFFNPRSFRYSLLLEWIIADNSRVTLSQLWSASPNLSIFQGLHHLRFINLSSNDLQTLPRGLFPNLPMLLDLNLDNCKISVIESFVFRGLRSLEKLYLDHNVILKLPHNMFNTLMGQLYLIYLNSNLLDNLDEDLFVNTPRLTNLSLSKNQYTTFSRNTFIPIQSTLKFIDLSKNPIKCSCQIKWLIGWRNSSIHIAGANQTVCSFISEAPFRGKLVFMIDPNKLCAPYLNLYYTLPLVAVGLLGIVSVAYHKRWSIKYKIFLFKSAVLGYKEIQNDHNQNDYEFDLNVCYINEDKMWATEYLRPKVKENLRYFDRIAFGDDDLPLGMYYLDAVLYVIEHSFKTILLLSRAATRDQGFMMKLRTALNHVTNTRTQCTLLIFLEDIADDELPHLVKLYMSEERPYIRWVEDVRGQKYFWKRLIKTLMVNLPRKTSS